jgi:hypothetical protein
MATFRNTRPPWTAPADDWARETAARMLMERVSAGAIIQHLEAYGIGVYAAQALVTAALSQLARRAP